MKLTRFWLAVALFFSVTVVEAATLTVYTAKLDWIANVTTFETETFDDLVLNTGVQVSSNAGFVNGGVWEDNLSPVGPLNTTTFSFDPALLAFGGDWDLTPGAGVVAGIRVTVTLIDKGIQVLQERIDAAITTGFFGFTSDVAFTDVLLEADHVINAESYTLDNMVYEQQITQNPIPAAVWLFGTGLLGLMGWSRKSQTNS